MSQFNASCTSTPSHASRTLNGNFSITRPMLLNACHDVEAELRRQLRRQRWLNLEKLLLKAIGR